MCLQNFCNYTKRPSSFLYRGGTKSDRSMILTLCFSCSPQEGTPTGISCYKGSHPDLLWLSRSVACSAFGTNYDPPPKIYVVCFQLCICVKSLNLKCGVLANQDTFHVKSAKSGVKKKSATAPCWGVWTAPAVTLSKCL